MSHRSKIIETFPPDSEFLEIDSRKNRWAIPYHYEALNARVENLIIHNSPAIKNKKILDLGCHFGSFAYACLCHGADSVYGIDTEAELVEKAINLFQKNKVPDNVYSFHQKDIIEFLTGQKENSFDTLLNLGTLYYLNDPFHCLKLMKKVTARYIILDTFTAYYGACVLKEGDVIFQSMKDETFELPIIIYPWTQAKKKDYTVKDHFMKKNRKISMLSLPTIPALENFFTLLNLKYTLLSWDNYIINNYTWKDFIHIKTKQESHWADTYHTKIRVSYLLEKV